MKKIPTLFMRDPVDRSRLLPEYHPQCGWVARGEGVATRKYDGTCVMFDGTFWWARREVKPDKRPPRDFQLVDLDPATGKQVGWEPIERSAFAKWHAEALDHDPVREVGTYELVGPKINGNPEALYRHHLVPHMVATQLPGVPVTYLALGEWLADRHIEGVVWHHPDGRMAKIKRRDYGLRWP